MVRTKIKPGLSRPGGGVFPAVMQMAPPNPSDTGLMSPNQISLTCVLRNAASDNDVVATAGGAVDNGTEEDAYVAFRNWISNSPDRMKPELAQLLYPVFTHLYLQLVLKNGKVEVKNKLKDNGFVKYLCIIVCLIN